MWHLLRRNSAAYHFFDILSLVFVSDYLPFYVSNDSCRSLFVFDICHSAFKKFFFYIYYHVSFVVFLSFQSMLQQYLCFIICFCTLFREATCPQLKFFVDIIWCSLSYVLIYMNTELLKRSVWVTFVLLLSDTDLC